MLTFWSSVSSSEGRGTIILPASAPLNRVCHVREDKWNMKGAKMLLLGLMVKSGLRRSKGGHCTEEKQWPQKLFFFCIPSAMFKYICQALHTLGDWWRSGSLFLYKHCLCLHKTANFTEKILSTKVSGLWLRATIPRERARAGWRLSCPQRQSSLEHLLRASRFVWRPNFQKSPLPLVRHQEERWT